MVLYSLHPYHKIIKRHLNYSPDNSLKLVASKGHFTIYDNNDRNYIPK